MSRFSEHDKKGESAKKKHTMNVIIIFVFYAFTCHYFREYMATEFLFLFRVIRSFNKEEEENKKEEKRNAV